MTTSSSSRKLTALCLLALPAVLLGLAGSLAAQSRVPLEKLPTTRKLSRPVEAQKQVEGPRAYVVKLAGSPVTVVSSLMPGKQLSTASRQTIVQNLDAQQNAMVPMIQSTGVQVLARFQHAINGIKVMATPDQVAALKALPGVLAVKPVQTYFLTNAESVPFIGAPQVWQGPPGLHGEHIKVAIIDTGIDYTHANFGGPGTVAAFQAAAATSTMPADPTMFGPTAPKVKGGTDLVGDAYNANIPGSMPVPDPNPLDCNGHGSHTSGTAAGLGVTAAGTTYPGPYDGSTPSNAFIIGPGVAPLADLYAVRVFGCSGSTNVVVDALDWAAANNMQVVSMSLGSNFGSEETADAEESENLVNAGIVVVAASGNAGPIPYITSSPGAGEKVISVAAMDSHQNFPAVNLALIPSGNIVALNANGATFSDGTTLPVVVLLNPNGTPSLGCNPAEYTNAGVQGKLVVTLRGTCARVARAIFGQQAGAAAVAMVNTSAGYPPYEGPITSNPDTGIPYTVTIPFLGIQGPPSSADATAMRASTSATMSNTGLTNPTFGQFASFSSGGPRLLDGHLKPEITAPGVSIFSTLSGSGNGGLFESGTSMATPHVAGSAALTIQAHPTWSASDIANAVVNTADATKLVGYTATLGGNGLVQPLPATKTAVSLHAQDGTPSLSFGVAEFTSNYSGSANLYLQNHGSSPASFNVSVAQGVSSPHTVSVANSVSVPGHATAVLKVSLAVPAATNGDSSAFRVVEGQIVLTPTSGNNGVKLSAPYYLVTRARSLVKAKQVGSLNSNAGTATVNVSNTGSLVPGSVDFYAWGLSGGQYGPSQPYSLRAVGAQSFTDPSLGQIVVFAVSTAGRISTFDPEEIDIPVDVNGDGTPDYIVVAADLGALQGLANTGQVVTAVFQVGGGGVLEFFATAPTDGSTILMPVVAGDMGVTAGNPRFAYTATLFDYYGGSDSITTAAKFNAFTNSITTAVGGTLPPGGIGSVPIALNKAEFANTPTRGEMVVSIDNSTNQGQQALLLPVK